MTGLAIMDFDGISIIIPFYNDARNIKRCLDAICRAISRLPSADGRRLEIIVVDDASQQPFSYQGTLVDSLFYHRLEKNRGVGAARNAGARLAKYKYLMFIDSDIFLEENHLAVVFDILRREKVKVLQGTPSIEPPNEHPKLFHYYMAISWHSFQSKYRRYFLATMCMVINHSFFSGMGEFPECYSDSGGEEFELSARIHEAEKDAITCDPRLIFYHNYPGLITRLKKILVRSPRLKPSLMPPAFQTEAGIRGTGAALMSLALLWFPAHPLTACFAYILLGVFFFFADWELSKCFIQQHSWRLALASVFYRQVEYSAVLCGVISGFFKKRL